MYSKGFVNTLFGALVLCFVLLIINFYVIGRQAYELRRAYSHYHIDLPPRR